MSSQVSVTQTSFDDFITQDISRSTTEKPFPQMTILKNHYKNQSI